MPLKTRLSVRFHPLACAVAALAVCASSSAWAQKYPITPSQRATAEQVAQTGVPLSELAPNAPDSYTVKRGDTLWAISRLFLKSPWRWPELWGMNREDIRNPHLIYPGQALYLIREGGRARLSARRPGEGDVTVKVSPRTRYESLAESAIPPVNLQAIEAFLTEPLIVDEATFAKAPRIVATPENRVLLTLGDRAYARGQYGNGVDLQAQALSTDAGQPRNFRVFRNATPLKDPTTGEILGYEAQYVGKAYLARAESSVPVQQEAAVAKPEGKDVYTPSFPGTHNLERVPVADARKDKPVAQEMVPATIDIVQAKEEIRVGDRLLPEPPREFSNYVPSAPSQPTKGQIVSVYGNAVRYAAQNQVVAINRGKAHGVENGHVLLIERDTHSVVDRTDDKRTVLRLPGERNGLMMVFRTFDKVSYALILQIEDGVKVGDRFTNP